MASYLERLLVSHPLRDTTLTEVIDYLRFPVGSRGLDAGSGAGLITIMLAKAIGPEGHVTGLDISSEFLSHARNLADNAGLSD